MTYAPPRRGDTNLRRRHSGPDRVLWGVPLALTGLAGILIASTQRQADYADWYQHWITAAIGMALALLLARTPVDRLRQFQWRRRRHPIHGRER